jgi:hypothetical protein
MATAGDTNGAPKWLRVTENPDAMASSTGILQANPVIVAAPVRGDYKVNFVFLAGRRTYALGSNEFKTFVTYVRLMNSDRLRAGFVDKSQPVTSMCTRSVALMRDRSLTQSLYRTGCVHEASAVGLLLSPHTWRGGTSGG